MSNKRYYWTLAVICLSAIVLAIIWRYPDYAKADSDNEQAAELGEYVYIDHFNIVHAWRKCKRLNYKNVTSRRVRINELRNERQYTFCTNCVSDETYNDIQQRLR